MFGGTAQQGPACGVQNSSNDIRAIARGLGWMEGIGGQMRGFAGCLVPVLAERCNASGKPFSAEQRIGGNLPRETQVNVPLIEARSAVIEVPVQNVGQCSYAKRMSLDDAASRPRP